MLDFDIMTFVAVMAVNFIVAINVVAAILIMPHLFILTHVSVGAVHEIIIQREDSGDDLFISLFALFFLILFEGQTNLIMRCSGLTKIAVLFWGCHTTLIVVLFYLCHTKSCVNNSTDY